MFASMKKLFGSAPRQYRPAPLRVEALEDRRMLTAGIQLGADGIIRVEGYDDAIRGEIVMVQKLNHNTLSPYDDQIRVTMTHGSSVMAQNFDIWKNVGLRLTMVRQVSQVSYMGLAGADSFTNDSNIAAVADGGAGIDVLKGGTNDDRLIGGAGNDTLSGRLGNDTLDGGAGADKLIEAGDVNFGLSDNSLTGLGSDSLSGIEVAELTGGNGANSINAKSFSGTVTIYGGLGDDLLYGGKGSNFLYGEAGNDTLNGNNALDRLYGGDGSDILDGQAGDDILFGGKGKDYLYGGAGDDSLDGGYDRKVDHLWGQGGKDTFLQHIWHETSSYFWEFETHRDKVHDREPGETVYQVQN